MSYSGWKREPMGAEWTRREFVSRATAALAFAGSAGIIRADAVGATPLRGRFLTHVSVVRVNQIEVTPTHTIGEDEAADNRPERIRSRRDALAAGCPGGRMTWAISWLALQDSR